MIILSIQPSLSREKHIATNWWIYEDEALTQVVKESLNDTVNLTTKIFDDSDLDPDKTYYAVAQELFETYDAEPSQASILRVKDNSSLVVNKDLPAAMPAPSPQILLDANNAPANFIPISIPPVQSDSDAYCVAVDIVITDQEGRVYYKELKSNAVTGKVIETAGLEPGKLYILAITQYASNGDVTPIGRTYFFVKDIKEFEVVRAPDPKSLADDEPYVLQLDLDPSLNLSSVTVDIYGIYGKELNKLTTVTSDTLAIVIDKSVFTDPYDTYMFAIKVTDTLNRTYGPLYHRVGITVS